MTYTHWVPDSSLLRNTPCYAVVDTAFVDAMTTKGRYEYSTAKGATSESWFIGNYRKKRILNDIYTDLDESVKEGLAYKADTIEELV
ncbi:MAG: hypothetical protein CVV47_02195 [Spirochaetae bacterium HGW-Spirochaetae-3]|jgi:fumarate reductase flavoprotein subunit|nr:MAG: hypothetical protein CVV47_02195 [Spirochaetae bacterium HGW-Spirochaetae-3]